MTKPTTMILHRGPDAWLVTTDDAEVRELFSTSTLPTGYTRHAPAYRVLTEIQRLNPDAVVRLASIEGVAP